MILQSPGAKARWIANPLLCIQAIGEPLKNKLLTYSLNYPEIKTTNQDAGHSVVVDWLESGRNVFSFDATAFTDRFPASLQLRVAEKLLSKRIIDLPDYEALEIVLNGTWWATDLNREIAWKVGQPLGYGPSFHLATLAHAMILDRIDLQENGVRTECWQVVGDDVVICDQNVALRYKEEMTQLGVEINLEKSLISHKYAEFLGKLITREGVNPSTKVRIFSGHSHLIDALAFYGWNGWRHLNQRQRHMAMDVFLPEHLGGLGWRIPGQSYSTYLSKVNLDKIRDRTVRKEIREFYGETGEPHSVSLMMQLRSEYYSRNSVPLSLSEWELIDSSVSGINELMDIPIHKSPAPARGDVGPVSNSFAELVDKQVRLENRTSESLFSQDGTVNRSNPATRILSNMGYIVTSEKRPSLQSEQPKEFSFEQQKPRPSKGIFSKDFRDEATSLVRAERAKLFLSGRRNGEESQQKVQKRKTP